MEGLGSVVFVLVMGIVWLLSQVFAHVGRRKAPTQEPAEEQPGSDAVEAARKVLAPRTIRRPVSAPRAERFNDRRSADLRKAGAASAVRIPARTLVTGRKNLRQAVIVMTVLGPPVSQQPGAASRPGNGTEE